MYKTAKFTILALYPFLKIVLPIVLFATLGLSLSKLGTVSDSLLSPFVWIEGLFSIMLVVAVIYYLFYITKHNLFSKKANGEQKANVADYFAMVFSIFAIVDIAGNLFKFSL